MTLIWSLAFGQIFWSAAWFLLGALHLMRPSVALILLGLGVVISGIELRRNWPAIRIASQRGFSSLLALSTAGILLLGLVSTLAPVTGKDAMVYRLAIPEGFAAAGGFVNPGPNIFGYLALGAEMNGTWALLASRTLSRQAGESAFAFTLFFSFPLLLAAVFAVCRRWSGSSRSAAVASFVLAAVPTLYFVASSSYIDHIVALYILLAVHSLGEWIEERNKSFAISGGLALGMACAVKLTAAFAIPGIGIALLIIARSLQEKVPDIAKHLLHAALLIFGISALIASPWYIRTWKLSGSPVFPFYAHIWPGHANGWDAERSQLSQIYLSQYGGSNKGFVDYLATPLKASISAQPENPSDYDGVIGVSFLVAVLIFILNASRRRLLIQSGVFLTVALVWSFAWLMTSQQIRFLLPALPLLLVAALATGKEDESGSALIRASLLIGSLGGGLTILAWFVELNALAPATGSESREQFLSRRLDYYPYYLQIQAETPPTSRIWLINMRNDTLNLGRPFVADYVFEDYTLTKLVERCTSIPQLQAEVDKLGVDFALIRHDVLFDYRRTPVVDERRPEAENQARLQLLIDFLRKGRKVLREDGKFLLVDLRRASATQ